MSNNKTKQEFRKGDLIHTVPCGDCIVTGILRSAKTGNVTAYKVKTRFGSLFTIPISLVKPTKQNNKQT